MTFKRARRSILRIGDRALVRNTGVWGRCKLADGWEKDRYIVTDQPNDDIPVYRVKRGGARSKNRILRCSSLVFQHTLAQSSKRST